MRAGIQPFRQRCNRTGRFREVTGYLMGFVVHNMALKTIPTAKPCYVTTRHDEVILDIRRQDGQAEGAPFAGIWLPSKSLHPQHKARIQPLRSVVAMPTGVVTRKQVGNFSLPFSSKCLNLEESSEHIKTGGRAGEGSCPQSRNQRPGVYGSSEGWKLNSDWCAEDVHQLHIQVYCFIILD